MTRSKNKRQFIASPAQYILREGRRNGCSPSADPHLSLMILLSHVIICIANGRFRFALAEDTRVHVNGHSDTKFDAGLNNFEEEAINFKNKVDAIKL